MTALERSRLPVVAVLTAKALVLLYGVAVSVVAGGTLIATPYDALRVFWHWDAAAYIAIAQHGYGAALTDRDLVFYPLFPGLIAGTTALLRDPLISAFVVATVASVLAVIALNRLASRDEDDATARATVLFFLVFPTSFVLHIPYSEGTFIALVVLAFLAARDGRWLIAGGLGALAAFTRANGIVVLFALCAEAYLAFRVNGVIRRAWGWILLVPLGSLAYLLVNEVVSGDPFRFITLLRLYWEKSLDWPWVGLARLVSWSLEPSGAQIIWMFELLFIVVSVAGTIAVATTLRPSYAVWMAGNTLLFLSTSTPLSVPRYALALFPLFIFLGRFARVPPWPLVVVVPSLTLSCFLVARFVLDQWAF